MGVLPLFFGNTHFSRRPRNRCGHRGCVKLGLFHGTHGVDADDVAQLFNFGSEATECLDVGHVTTGSDGRTCLSYARTAIFWSYTTARKQKMGRQFLFLVCLFEGWDFGVRGNCFKTKPKYLTSSSLPSKQEKIFKTFQTHISSPTWLISMFFCRLHAKGRM